MRFPINSMFASMCRRSARPCCTTGKVDLGLIPAIEYLRGDYRIVPDVSIASDGEVATVAVFTRKPISQVRTIALDLSSRTSVALTRVLCAKQWHIEPSFTPAEPDLEAMLGRADAALLIGDPAFAIDPRKRGVTKIDLGAEVEGHDRAAIRVCDVGGPSRRGDACPVPRPAGGARSRAGRTCRTSPMRSAAAILTSSSDR